MGRNTARLKLDWRDADKLISAVHSQKRVSGLTHDFYKYPARFSPEFSRTAIEVFSDPGDHVVDPFVGGGTTLVEARSSGRLGIGTDISSLANFVSTAKTRLYSNEDIAYVRKWIRNLPSKLNLRQPVKSQGQWKELGYFKNLGSQKTWALRKSIELAVMHASRIRDNKRENLIRCIILRSAQWALDGRKEFPTVEAFREHVTKNSESILAGAIEFRGTARKADRIAFADGKPRTVCIHGRASELADFIKKRNRPSPSLVVTSPPYPGVHILYHRWQVHGGRETPAPFWIANQLDGSGLSYYLMNARQPELTDYFNGIHDSFSAISSVAASNTTIMQLVAFSDPDAQLPRYLNVMEKCGFQEYRLSDHLDSKDGRLWRGVPGRKWYADHKGDLASGKEVVLIHRRK